ncbi:MAG: deoxynucleoside kinase, partial [Myxococcales bacterium]
GDMPARQPRTRSRAKPAPEVAPAGARTPEPRNEVVADRPKRVKLKPKYFLAMAGNIGAGKTTAAKLISQRLGFELFDEPVIDNRFLKDYYASMGRWSFTLQLEFLIRRVEHHELIHTVSKSCVQDRTLYEDPEIFAKYLHGLGHMNDRELELYFEYFQRLNRNLSKPDKIICFDVPDTKVLLRRIRDRGRAEEKSIGADFLRGLNGYYSSFPQVVQSKYGIPCLTIDVTEMDIRAQPSRDDFLDRVTTFLRS